MRWQFLEQRWRDTRVHDRVRMVFFQQTGSLVDALRVSVSTLRVRFASCLLRFDSAAFDH